MLPLDTLNPLPVADQVSDNLDELLFALELAVTVEELADAAGCTSAALREAVTDALRRRHGVNRNGNRIPSMSRSPMTSAARLWFAGVRYKEASIYNQADSANLTDSPETILRLCENNPVSLAMR